MLFSNMTQKQNVKHKTKPWFFFWNFHLSYSPIRIIHKNSILFFFSWKWVFYSIIFIFIKYLQYCHCHQYTNPPWTTNLMLLMHQSLIFTLHILLLMHINYISFTVSLYSLRKTKILILNFVMFKLMIICH